MYDRRMRLDIEASQQVRLDPDEVFPCNWERGGRKGQERLIEWPVTEVTFYETFVRLGGFYSEGGRFGGGNRLRHHIMVVHKRHPNWMRLPEWLVEQHRAHVEICEAIRILMAQMVSELPPETPRTPAP